MITDTQAVNDVRNEASKLNTFDYSSPAELFWTSARKRRGNITYRRFGNAADALRFAVEELPPPALVGAYLEVDEVRFGSGDMRSLYESAAYPLIRTPRAY